MILTRLFVLVSLSINPFNKTPKKWICLSIFFPSYKKNTRAFSNRKRVKNNIAHMPSSCRRQCQTQLLGLLGVAVVPRARLGRELEGLGGVFSGHVELDKLQDIVSIVS